MTGDGAGPDPADEGEVVSMLQMVFTSAPWCSGGVTIEGRGVAMAYYTEVHIPQGIAQPQLPKVRYRAWPHTLGKVEVYTFGVNGRQRTKRALLTTPGSRNAHTPLVMHGIPCIWAIIRLEE